MLVGNLNEQMWFSTANRLNDCVSSKNNCHQVSVLENIKTFVHFLKLFVCHSVDYYLSNCQIKYIYVTSLVRKGIECRQAILWPCN